MEQDGTVGADEAEETKRQKDESWAVFTEENAKGAGNTMNRCVSLLARAPVRGHVDQPFSLLCPSSG